MSEPIKKRVDESWKEQAEREKHVVAQAKAAAPGQPGPSPAAPASPAASEPEAEQAGGEESPQARFDLFITGLAMEALIALGEMAHPATRRTSINLTHAKYLIDVLGILEAKTRGNLSADEEHLLKDTLYQLRMRYLSRAGAPASG